MRLLSRAALALFALTAVHSSAWAQDSSGCPTTRINTMTPDGLVFGHYESGYRWGNESGCYDPWQFIQVQVTVAAADRGRAGLMYIGAFDKDMDGAVLREDGQWEPYRGGIHDPTAAFERLPGQMSFTIFDTRGAGGFTPWQPVSRGQPPMTICTVIESFGKLEMELGGGYGAIQEDAQQSIERIENVPGQRLDTDHLRVAYAYNDGMANRKYGSVFNFACHCSIHPIEAGGGCSDTTQN